MFDFKIGLDDLFQKDYLAGLYGDVPYAKDFELNEGKLFNFRSNSAIQEQHKLKINFII